MEEVGQEKMEEEQEVYEAMKAMVWVVKVERVVNKRPDMKCVTAFGVHESGLLMTAAHEWYYWKHKTFKVRRLDGMTKFEDATVVALKLQYDLCLLKIVNTTSSVVVAKFGSGKLEVGQPLMAIGHPYDAFGSGLLGRVVYPCLELGNFEFAGTNDAHKCGGFDYDDQQTPSYRIMGHICNRTYDFHANSLGFVRDFHACIPIIHSAGLVGSVGDGLSGAPIFTRQGAIVGMFVFGLDGFDVGIHVTVLDKFLSEYKTKIGL